MGNKKGWNGEIGEDYVMVEGHKLDQPHHMDFVIACRKVGLEPFFYRGRFCYLGPAVVLPRITDVSRLGIDIPLVWDNFAKEYIIYPSKSANETDSDRIKAMMFVYELNKNDYNPLHPQDL